MYIYNFFATLRTLFIFIYLSIYPSGRYRKKCFFSIVGKSFDIVVRLTFTIYSFMLLVKSSLIFRRIFFKDIPHLIHLFSFYILVDYYSVEK